MVRRRLGFDIRLDIVRDLERPLGQTLGGSEIALQDRSHCAGAGHQILVLPADNSRFFEKPFETRELCFETTKIRDFKEGWHGDTK